MSALTTLSSTSVDDRHGNVTYVPDRWTVHVNVESIYHLWNNTDTFSDIQNATATLKFYGDAVEYWGNQGPYHGPCIVSIDGQEMTTINSHATADGYPIMLFAKSNLSLGMHELQVRVVNPSYPNVCEVDRFVVNITSAPTGGDAGKTGNGDTGSGGSPTNNGVPPRRKSGPPIGIIAGTAGSAVGLFVLFLLWVWLRKKSKRKASALRGEKISKPVFVDNDSNPGYHSPPSSSFAQGYGVNYSSLLRTPLHGESSAILPSSANTSIYVSAASASVTSNTYDPYMQYLVHPNVPSPVPVHSLSPTTTATRSTIITGSLNPGSSRADYEHTVSHANLIHLTPNSDESRTLSTTYSPPVSPATGAAQQYQPSATYLAKEREAFANSGNAVPEHGSGSGSSSSVPRIHDQQGPMVVPTSPDVGIGDDLPPPAYER